MLKNIQSIIISAIKEGGRYLKKNFGTKQKTYKKTIESDFYTDIDLHVEKMVLDRVLNKFPDFNVLSEEAGGTNRGSEYTFVLDPLDGTNNYSLDIPYFSIAAALMKGGVTVFSCVYSPMLNNLYTAELGRGAKKNGQVIGVSEVKKFKKANFAYVTGYSNLKDIRLNFTKKLYQNYAERILDNWCPTLDYCLLAEGRIECIINDDDDLHESIIGKLLIKEAGGILTDFNGRDNIKELDNKFIATNNKVILNKLLKLII